MRPLPWICYRNMSVRLRVMLLPILLLSLFSLPCDAVSRDSARSVFEDPPADARIMMRWWWFGPAVATQELQREMEQMKAAGIGGFEIQPVYPLVVDDPSKGLINLRFLSPEFLRMINFAATHARRLGLRMDVTLGSGWPYGGPYITPELASTRLEPRPSPHGVKTGQQVKRAAVGAEGPVLDHYNRQAIELHLSRVGDKLTEAAGPGGIYAVFCDSLEVYGGNWTGDLPREFRERRGYDLTPMLPRLQEQSAEADAIRHDYGQTLSELYEDQFLVPLAQWARRHHVQLRMQNYGTPPATLASAARVDLPEGEGWHWRTITPTRWASSASHLFARPVTSSETWTWVHSPVFRATPLDLKAEADQHFLCGVNQLVGHGWPYSPPEAGEPGWTFYAAGALNAHNPWWPVMTDLSRYLRRVSALLRLGEPVVDVGVYLSNDDAWAGFSSANVDLARKLFAHAEPVVPPILHAGMNFDVFDEGSAEQALRRYRVVVLPAVARMSLGMLGRLETFRASGGTVIAVGEIPSLAPGWKDRHQSPEVARRAQRLMRNDFVANASGLKAALLTHLPADFASPDLDATLGFVHRRLEDADLYFVVNTGNRPRRVQVQFRTRHTAAERWNPLTGERQSLAPGSRQTVDLTAYGSTILIFSDHPGKAAPQPALATVDLSRGWSVTVDDEPSKQQQALGWTRAVHGVVYRKPFTLEAGNKRTRVLLDLGAATASPPGRISLREDAAFAVQLDPPVREAAEIRLNGRRAGSAWCPPYRVDLTPFIRAGTNQLEIHVYPTAMNRMARQPAADYTTLNAKYGRRFEMQNLDEVHALPTGLLGPVRLLIERENQ